MSRRKRNPNSITLGEMITAPLQMINPLVPNPSPGAVVGGLALLGLAGWGVYELTKDEKPKEKKNDGRAPVSPLSGVYAENATLGNSPGVISQILLPLSLGTHGAVQLRGPDEIVIYPNLTLEQKANGVTSKGKVVPGSWKDALEDLVTNMTASATAKAYELLMIESAAAGRDLNKVDASTMAAAQRVLKAIAPKVKWTNQADDGLKYGLMSPEAALWAGVLLLGDIAAQSLKNKPNIGPSDEEIDGQEPPPPPEPEFTEEEMQVITALKNKLLARMQDSIQGNVVKYSIAPTPVVLLDEWLVEDVSGPLAKNGFSGLIGVFEDDVTKSTGQHLGIAVYDSNTDDGMFEYRGKLKATLADESDRIEAIRDKLINALATKQTSL